MSTPIAVLLETYPQAERQTEKDVGKVVPCRECEKPLLVNSFYAPAKAICSSCKGVPENGHQPKAAIAVVRPGHTDPAKAINLHDCLINPHFAFAFCPVHPDDEAHEMELKNVNHNEHYGPSELIGYTSNGRPNYRQIAPGETCLWQCKKCRATVSYSTTVVVDLMRQNELQAREEPSAWPHLLGART